MKELSRESPMSAVALREAWSANSYSAWEPRATGGAMMRRLLTDAAPLSEGYAIPKRGATVVSYMAGIPGGLFSPSLSIGAGLAQWVHAAFTRAPMAAVIAPPLYEALAKSNYFGVAALPPGGFLQKKPVPPPGA